MTDRVPVYGESGVFLASALEAILSILENHGYSKETQEECSSFLKMLEQEYYGKDPEMKLLPEDRRELQRIVELWHDRIWNELSKLIIFEASTAGMLNPEKLFSGASSFFSQEIWEKLQTIEQLDLDESAKSLLTSSWTSAGVMAMRALESGIRTYCSKFGQNYTKKMSFGQMVGELKKSSKVDSKFVGYLDYLKDTRNDLAHPNVRIEQYEAEQVFQHTVYVLEKIYSWTSK
ncbi:MAG: DUF4145 domain-containing protein [Candidatus Heimdallarchaeota archaeon]|nr:DUF4145 domain-containing protein [Candidatus Heimdallarchaeota archaeon]